MTQVIWEKLDESMIYPTGYAAIPYTVYWSRGEPTRYKMIAGIDAPKDFSEKMRLWEVMDQEFSEITGMWAGELVDLIDAGKIEFDTVFVDQLTSERKITV